jgi:3-oxoacyl-[acyl-carrier-protein] synthase II
MSRRVVITGIGLITPLGNSAEKLGAALAQRQSGVGPLTTINPEGLPTRFGAEAREFTGSIDDFGPLEKTLGRNIKKNLKVMCREIQMGVAVAQLALTSAGVKLDQVDRDRFGVLYGSDYMLTLPQEFITGIRNCLDEQGRFQFTRWAEKGLPAVEPLWLLKYLPNLPASHVAIFNDLHGPNNSLTVREASSNLAVAEAYHTIVRGHADQMIAGATGTRVHPARTLHVVLQEEIAQGSDPARLSRPFDADRNGLVLGEGAAAFILEELETAQKRGATILGEVIGYGSSAVADKGGAGVTRTAVRNVLRQAMQTAGLKPDQVGHLSAHGASTRAMDMDEAQAIAEVFAERKQPVPVVAAKSYFGNLGASSGLVEAAASLLALREGKLFATLNYETPDAQCPVQIAGEGDPAGENFISVNVTPQGQASAIVIKRFAA